MLIRHVHVPRIVEPRVVTLADRRDDHVVDSDRRLLGHEQAASRVEDPAHLHRRGEEDRRLEQAPLIDLAARSQLTSTIEDGNPCRHRRGPRVTEIDDGDTRSSHPSSEGRGRIVVDDR